MKRRNVLLFLAAMSIFLGTGGAASAQNLFVDDWGAGTFHQYSPTGTDLGTFASFSGPLGLAVDSSGDVFVSGYNIIQQYSPTGAVLGSFNTGIGEMYGVTFNSSGNLFITDSGRGVVDEFSPSGTNLGTFATGLSVPVFLTFGTVPTATPEPGSLALLAGLFVAGATFARRRRR